ncbi:MAG: phytase [bacterium]|nr:phytase [bacterium]
MKQRSMLFLLITFLLTGLVTAFAQDAAPLQVTALVETAPTQRDGATAPIVWIHPTDPALSLVIGTDENGGLGVYDLSGAELQYVADGGVKNADLRYNFELAEQPVTLLTAGLEDETTVLAYVINPQTRQLESVGSFETGIAINGLCMYRSPVNNTYYTFVNSEDGDVEQWSLEGNEDGTISASLERSFSVGGETEGCVADDDLRDLYLGEEEFGIWKYGAEPESGDDRDLVEMVEERYGEQVEGLTLYYASGGTGYLIASDEAGSRFQVYERQDDNAYIGAFEIVDGAVDGVNEPNGIDVMNVPLGEQFPEGAFIASDDNNTDPTENINFKLVSWSDIAAGLNLTIDTQYDPRVGEATSAESDAIAVAASAETAPVPSGTDAADDPAIWIHPTDTSLSTIIGSDKTGGIVVYDLSGAELQYVEIGRINNVDLRYNFPLAGEQVALVGGTNRDENTIELYRVNAETRQLEQVGTIESGVREVYGFCMYVSPSTGRYYAFVNSTRDGGVEQWELSETDGQVSGTLVRSFTVGTQTEGCAADDELGFVYIGEEGVGVWKYGAEPEAGEERTAMDNIDGNLTADVEGITIYYGADGAGYILVSAQGASEFVVYERGGENAYVGTFSVIAGAADAVSGTDGIDVTNFPLGDLYPEGVFVAQDDFNIDPDDNQNFKLVAWSEIAAALGLTVDTTFDPRTVGQE